MTNVAPDTISVIVPTIGRPDSLTALLGSLCAQTLVPDEVVIADGSDDGATAAIAADPAWQQRGLTIRHVRVGPPNAVRQRMAAIAMASGLNYLFLDDDVVLAPDCVAELYRVLQQSPDIAAASAAFSNEAWPGPTRAWRLYFRLRGIRISDVQGRVIGPLLRYGYFEPYHQPVEMEWMGTCNTLVRRAAYEASGGFSDFFLRRCTMNEDVDLGLKLKSVGRILLVPTAQLAHHHHPSGRVTPHDAAEDDIYNRYMVLRHTVRAGRVRSFGGALTFALIESTSNFLGAVPRRKLRRVLPVIGGRFSGLARIIGARRPQATGE